MNFSTENSVLEKAYRYCESVTRFHARSFYFAAKFLPRAKQRAVYPIYAFCRHVDDEIDEIGDGDQAEAVKAVEKWRSTLQRIYDGQISRDQTTANNGQTEVFTAWRDLLKNYEIPAELPFDLVRGVLMDTTVTRYETFDELYVYCYRVASTVGLMSSEILGYSDRRALEHAEAMGIAMQLTNILRDVKEDAAMGRIYLPLEDLKRFAISEAEIFANEFTPKFAEMMKFQVARAREFYEKGEKGIAFLEKDSRFTVLLASRIYAKILNEIEKQNYNVFARRARTTRIQKFFSIPKIWLQTPR